MTEKNKCTVLLVEDSDNTRDRIAEAVISGGQFDLLSAVGTFEEGRRLLTELQPDILLTDLDLPDGNGLDLIKLLSSSKSIKTELAIVVTIFGDEGHVINALKAGASGYLLKDDNFIEINNAIEQMVAGGAPISPSIARYLLGEFTTAPSTNSEKVANGALSAREQEILTFVSKGYTSKEIATMLDVSFHTVNAHVKKIYKKLSVNNRTEAIYEATRQGIL